MRDCPPASGLRVIVQLRHSHFVPCVRRTALVVHTCESQQNITGLEMTPTRTRTRAPVRLWRTWLLPPRALGSAISAIAAAEVGKRSVDSESSPVAFAGTEAATPAEWGHLRCS